MGKKYAPQMHTAEHILNATMVDLFGCDRCFSAHINPKKSKCDYRFDRNLTEMEALKLAERINEQILADQDVGEETVSLDQAREQFSLTRLPDGVKSVRIVRVGDYDACPCIGEHVNNTSEIGLFKLTSHSFEKDVLRILFKLVNRT